MDGRFFRRNLAEFLQPFNQRMVARQGLSASIWMDGISAAVTDMTNRHLLAKDKRSCQGGAASRSRLCYGPLCIIDGRAHQFLNRFIHA